MRLWLFLHWVGVILWLGGGVTGMLVSIRARDEPPATRAALARLMGPAYTGLVGPGAVLTAVSGIVLTMRLAGGGMEMGSPGLMLMQGAGLIGALVVLVVVLPAASRMGRVARDLERGGQLTGTFAALRRRLVVGSSIGGSLGVLALIGALWP